MLTYIGYLYLRKQNRYILRSNNLHTYRIQKANNNKKKTTYISLYVIENYAILLKKNMILLYSLYINGIIAFNILTRNQCLERTSFMNARSCLVNDDTRTSLVSFQIERECMDDVYISRNLDDTRDAQLFIYHFRIICLKNID